MWVEEQIQDLGPNHQDEELLQTQQCLHEVKSRLSILAPVIVYRDARVLIGSGLRHISL